MKHHGAGTQRLFSDEQGHLFEKSYQEQIEEERNRPVECLGLSFANDEERRKYFLDILREKLKDPEFRKIEGFPLGTDEDILALSDPPYYTACPNPFIADFVKHHGKPYDPEVPYSREPFAADTSAGKAHPIYTAHSYHSKIPHLAIMPYILHYTDPGDIVFDGFSGSGMTGVAAQLCGQPEPDFKVALEGEWKEAGFDAPTWGARIPMMIDLSPVANFIAYNLNFDMSADKFEAAAKDFFNQVDNETSWMYETLHIDGRTKGRISHVVWSEVFTCPNCIGNVIFWERAFDPKTGKFTEQFDCPHCGVSMTTRNAEHSFSGMFDEAIGRTTHRVTYVPVEIEYTVPGRRGKYCKTPDSADLALIEKLRSELPKDRFPSDPIPEAIYHYSRLAPKGVTHFHHFFLPRALHAMSIMWRIASEHPDVRMRNGLRFLVSAHFANMSIMNRHRPEVSFPYNPSSGVYYIPPCISEASPLPAIENRISKIQKLLSQSYLPRNGTFVLSTASSLKSPLPDNSIDYIYTDLPFGDFVPYGDLNLLIESWHQLFADLQYEVLVDKKRGKSVGKYGLMMMMAFAELYRLLKPGRWATVVFHNSKNAIWNVLQDAIGSAGFVIADVRTMDRGTGSYRQYTAQMAVKADVIISAYKPNSGLEARFKLTAGTEDGAWDFIRTHLKQLPVFVLKDGQVEVITERQNYLLFDRMVAFHVQRGVTVPLSAAEFYAGLEQRFPARDGMYFLSDQVAEYDRKRMTVRDVEQLQLFVTDESSAIQWLKQQLFKKPQTFQELHPQFLREIGGWQKHEVALELSDLLEQNFLRYDGRGEVPSQIHSHLSSNYRELRNLPKDDESLRVKGRDRWYVPDPNKAGDLEMLREKALLREFEEYRTSGQKLLKVFRLEAVRAGFRRAWQERDYATIIAVARKIPEVVLQEDPKLLMWYDQAVTRSGEE